MLRPFAAADPPKPAHVQPGGEDRNTGETNDLMMQNSEHRTISSLKPVNIIKSCFVIMHARQAIPEGSLII